MLVATLHRLTMCNKHPKRYWGQSHDIRFKFCDPCIFGMGENGHFKFGRRIHHVKYLPIGDELPPRSRDCVAAGAFRAVLCS